MNSRELSPHYTAPAKALHWLIAVLLLALLALGYYMPDLPLSPDKIRLYSWHKWAGITVFLLVLLRLLWRATHRPPALPPHVKPLLRLAAHATHALLYALMLLIPVSGWLMSSAKGVQTVWFGVVPLPDLVERSKELGATLADVHGLLNGLLVLLVGVHVLAAVKHHLVDRDDVLARMLPRRRATRRGPPALRPARAETIAPRPIGGSE